MGVHPRKPIYAVFAPTIAGMFTGFVKRAEVPVEMSVITQVKLVPS